MLNKQTYILGRELLWMLTFFILEFFSQKIENIKLCLFSWSSIIKPVKHIEAYGWSKQWIANWEGQNVKNLHLGNDYWYSSFVGSPVLSQAVQWIWTDTIFKKWMATTVSQGRLWGEHL